MRPGYVAVLLSVLVPSLAQAQPAAPPADPPPRLTIGDNGPEADPNPDAETLGYGQDENQRMVLSVSVSGSGPFQFVIDTGAERTSISRELADSLRLAPGGNARVHSMTDVSAVETFLIPTLQFGDREISRIRAPAFSRSNIGADGVLGADALQQQRVLFDFRRQEISISPSAQPSVERWPADTIVVTARRRHGRLVLVDAMVEGHRVWVIVDTGSQVTVANSRLQRLLLGRTSADQGEQVVLHDITGGTMTARYTRAREVQIGEARIRELPIAFADAEPFRQLNLMDRPAILLGMDTLALFERVSVDFGNRRVRLLLRPGSPRDEQSIWRRLR